MRTTGRKTPCKDCPDRRPGCHSGCDRYRAWQKEWSRLKEKERAYKEQLRIFERKK